MNQLQTFNFEQLPVRTFEFDGEPYFVGKDVAEILGYAKARNAIAKHVDVEDKKDAPIRGTLGGTQNMTLINESGLYSLIFSSKLESAKRFKRWVTSEVLPQIRQTGQFIQKPLTTAEQIKLIAQGNSELDERVTAIEETIPLFPGEQKHVQKLVKRKAYEIMKNQFNGIPQGRISRKIYSAIYRSLYIAFNVPNYQSIPRGRYQAAVKFLETWQLPSEVGYQIEMDLESETA